MDQAQTDHARSDGLPHAVALEGISNLRDLGGYPSRFGGRVRRGVLFRSASLTRATGADLEVLRGLGLGAIVDFRGAAERERAPTPVDFVPRHELPIEPTVGASLRDILATRDATGEDLMVLLRRAYHAYALECVAQYRALFALAAEARRAPVLFHCSAGKDRTGFGAAMLLTALGVAWEDVLDDYLATNRLWRGETVPSDDLPPVLRRQLMRAHAGLLEAAFEAMRHAAGSADAYLAQAFGVDAAMRARMVEALVEPA